MGDSFSSKYTFGILSTKFNLLIAKKKSAPIYLITTQKAFTPPMCLTL